MSYIKNIWQTGDVITADKLNHIEEAIASIMYGGVMNIFAQTDEPDIPLGLWVNDIKATGETYLFDTLDVNTNGIIWEAQTSIPYVLHDHGAAVIGDNLYLVGGVKNSTSTTVSDASADCIKFNLTTQTWSTCAPMPSKKFRPCVCVWNNKLYVLHCVDCGAGDDSHLNWYVYTPETDSWALEFTWIDSVNTINTDACVVVGDYLYIMGGSDAAVSSSSHVGTNKCWKYDLVNKTLTQIANMSIAHNLGSASAIGDKIIISGGSFYNSKSSYGTTQITECYDTITGIWTSLTDCPVKRNAGRCATAMGKIWFVAGGAIPYVYDVATDTWESFARVRPDSGSDVAELGASLVAYNNHLWFSGGRSGNSGSIPDGAQYRYRIDVLEQYEDGDVFAVCQPSSSSVLIGENRIIPLGAVYVKNNDSLEDASCYVGDGTSWTIFQN